MASSISRRDNDASGWASAVIFRVAYLAKSAAEMHLCLIELWEKMMSGLPDADVKQVVTRAKNWLSDVLADEHPSNVGLDEIEYDVNSGLWKITIGFSRPWNIARQPTLAATTGSHSIPGRDYRVITLDAKTRDVISMKRRSPEKD